MRPLLFSVCSYRILLMRISRRPSGGRGEYEISESSPEGVTPTDILEHRLVLDFGSGLVVDTNTTLRHQGGKFRVRLLGKGVIHPHRQVASLLMMPKPVREDVHWGRGSPVMRANQYSVEHIYLERAIVGEHEVRLEAGDLVLRNASYAAEELKLAERVQAVRNLWKSAEKFPDHVKVLIDRHEALAALGDTIPIESEQIVAELQEILTVSREEFGIDYRSEAEDIIPDLQKSLKWAEEPPKQPAAVDDIPPEEIEIRRREIKNWKRWASYRGAKSARFRQHVRTAYNSTCIVCGLHLPPTQFNSVAGVDAAHILPWADYDLDEVSNGLCLCKLHHWAFDEGLVLIQWDGAQYVVEVPGDVVAELKKENRLFSIDELSKHAGPIPEERLPMKKSERPRPQLLDLFVEQLKSNGGA